MRIVNLVQIHPLFSANQITNMLIHMCKYSVLQDGSWCGNFFSLLLFLLFNIAQQQPSTCQPDGANKERQGPVP